VLECLDHAANRILGLISLIMDHAVAVGMRPDNPAHGIKRLRHKSEGFATWSEYDIEAYRAYWPLGSRERLALEAITHRHFLARRLG